MGLIFHDLNTFYIWKFYRFHCVRNFMHTNAIIRNFTFFDNHKITITNNTTLTAHISTCKSSKYLWYSNVAIKFCSVGIVFKLSHALLKTRPIDHFDLREYLDIVALGTVADLVPLIKENRILVKKGLAVMANTKNVGLAALSEIAGIRPPYSAMDISFRLGPRINAAGRLDSATRALELLLCKDPLIAKNISEDLEKNNKQRQDGLADLARLGPLARRISFQKQLADSCNVPLLMVL